MTNGECNCGGVSFEITADISDVFICHCSICRRSTGSGGIAVVIVKTDDFKWCSGRELINNWTKPGHDWQTSFCVTCGSSLPGNNDDSHMYIPAGLLSSDDSRLKVTHHLWVNSKPVWEKIGDSGKQHLESFEG